MIHGVDVASYQGKPNWSEVQQSGIAFAFSKASQGDGYVNPTWTYNRSAMLCLGEGFVPGAYHFLEAGTASSGVAQARHFQPARWPGREARCRLGCGAVRVVPAGRDGRAGVGR